MGAVFGAPHSTPDEVPPKTIVFGGAGIGTNPGHRSVDMVCPEECEAVDFTGVAR